ncbi:hypothetical protein T440DRAFT_464830 [Plenodomus tracheiphilus IPT5]|uniref:Uncharacterized protein n=1 Tax=Plenodomus tracheiphilus IPT5 TaxID=1408161 RepID=A0A6A7BJU6_9PLEO|nr:hypothetical protein T440DRAFT_464830 [Plenodomus tracheiphilus IPT5]
MAVLTTAQVPAQLTTSGHPSTLLRKFRNRVQFVSLQNFSLILTSISRFVVSVSLILNTLLLLHPISLRSTYMTAASKPLPANRYTRTSNE